MKFNGPNLKKLLNDIVPKDISHQLVRCLQNLSEHHLPLSRSGPLQLLLDKSGFKNLSKKLVRFWHRNLVRSPLNEAELDPPGSMLVLRELHHVSWKVTELEVGEAVVSEVFQ